MEVIVQQVLSTSSEHFQIVCCLEYLVLIEMYSKRRDLAKLNGVVIDLSSYAIVSQSIYSN